MKKIARLTAFTLLIFNAFHVSAQDFSNKGKDFWIGYGNHCRMFETISASNPAEKMQLYITSDVSTTGVVNIPGISFTQNFTVTANQITTIDIPRSAALMDQGYYNLGIHVTAVQPVVVYSFIYVNAVSGATVCLPTNTLGKEYYSVNYKQLSNQSNSYSYFFVVATDTGTTNVEITPSATTKFGQAANVPFTVSLTQGQIYQVLGQVTSNSGVDLTGSKIKSISSGTGGCKKIGVFCGSGKISIGCSDPGVGSSDNLYQQIYPTAVWGKSYITVPSTNLSNASNYQTNFYRIVRPDPTSVVTLNGVVIPSASFTNSFYYQFSNNITNVITSDKPILVAQYFTTTGGSAAVNCNNTSPGDPEMIYLNPLEQTIAGVTLNSMQPANNTNLVIHFLNVVLKNTPGAINTFKIDGISYASRFIPVPQNTSYAYARINVPSQGHTLTCDSGFNVIAYGFGSAESYGYSGGTNLRDLYQFVSVQNQYAQVNYPATCKGSPFRFSMTFPYQPAEIQWKFNGLFPDITITSPVYDSTWIVNGKTLYKYKLTAPYTIATAGTYPVKVLAQNPTPDGCSGEQEINYDLVVLDRPTADFNFQTNGCVSTPVAFTDNTPAGSSVITNWQWDFGDGNFGNVKNPSHSYTAGGPYTVRLSIITDVGCISDTVPKTIVLSDPPVADFIISTPNCVNKANTFTDASTSPGSAIVKWYWDFGDGSPVITATTNAAQTHIYNSAGPYTATLKVESASGCQSILKSQTFNIWPNLVSSFSFGNACLPIGAMQFTNTTTVGATPGTSLAACNWTFSEGGTSANCNPLHNYSAVGPFTATLTVTSDKGCTDDTTMTVATIYTQPKAIFAVDKKKSCTGTNFSFTTTSNAPGNSVSSWNWNFGDGSPVTTVTTNNAQTHSFSTAGTYAIAHWITSAAGCVSDTARDTLIVYSPPVANFTIDPHRCTGDTIYLQSNSNDGGAGISQYSWFVNNLPISSGANILKYVPAAPGTISFRLSIITAAGCTDDSAITITVHPKPVPVFDLPNVCLPTGAAVFNNSTTISDGTQSAITYLWNFGDPAANGSNPNTSTQITGSHFYSSTGNYPVTLTATSSNGCVKDSIRTLSTVYAQPQALFTAPAEVCLGDSITFTDQSTAPASTIAQWAWTFDDGTTSTQKSPLKFFAIAGTHTATLTVTSTAGCSSVSFQKQVIVNPLPVSRFTIPTTTCETKNVSFVNQSLANAGSIINWTWNMGIGVDTVRTNGNPFNYIYSSWGPYHVTLQTKTDKGCISPLFDTLINIYPQPIPGFAMSENCLIDPYSQFTDTTTIADGSQAAFTYLWNFGDPNANGSNPNTATGALPQPKHKFIVATTYPVSMTVTSNHGCTASVQQQFTINGSVPQSDFTIQGSNHCSNDSVKFINNSIADVGSIIKLEVFWDYSNNPAAKDVDQFPVPGKVYSHLYPEFFTPATKSYTIRVVAYSGDFCLKDSMITINVQATPDISFSPLTAVCANAASYIINNATVNNLSVINGSGVYSGPGVSANGSITPSISGAGMKTIRYTYTGGNSCSNYVEKNLEIFPVPSVNAGPDKLVLEGGLDSLEGSGSGNNIIYLWTPNKWLTSYVIARPKVSPLDDIMYTLTVTSSDGCTVSDNVFVKVLKAPTIPNLFTPNNDGINDTWEILYLGSYPGATLEVYNRYGQMIFHSVGYSKPWDGKVNGNPVPVGTYYYIINPKNGRKQLTGFVDILR
jgi:gliding motility-associated-like protein